MSCNCCDPCNNPAPEPDVTLPDCEGGEPCFELTEDKCVKYTGPTVGSLDITTGDRLDVVIAKLVAALTSQEG